MYMPASKSVRAMRVSLTLPASRGALASDAMFFSILVSVPASHAGE